MKSQDQGEEVALLTVDSLPGRHLQCDSHVKQELSQRGCDRPRSEIRNWWNAGVDHRAKVFVGTCFCEGFGDEICIK